MIASRLLGLAILLAAGAAWADPPPAKGAIPAKEAVARNDEAWALYEQGRYRAAIEKLTEAARLDPNSKDLVYNLALIHEKLARFDEAASYYERYVELEKDPKAKARAQGIVKRLRGAQRERDERGAPAVGAPRRDALPAAPPPARPVRPWVIVTGSIAGSAFLVGSIFGLSALARNPGDSARTGAGVGIDDLQHDARVGHTNAVVADIAFLVAAAATGTAAFLYFTTPRAPRQGRSPASVHFARVAALPGALRVTW